MKRESRRGLLISRDMSLSPPSRLRASTHVNGRVSMHNYDALDGEPNSALSYSSSSGDDQLATAASLAACSFSAALLS